MAGRVTKDPGLEFGRFIFLFGGLSEIRFRDIPFCALHLLHLTD